MINKKNIIKFLIHPMWLSLASTYLIGPLHTAMIGLIVFSFWVYIHQDEILDRWFDD